MQVVRYMLKKFIFPGAAVLVLFCGCSDEKAAPLPKAHPELLFEICENGKMNDYTTMLPKIQRLRAIDQTSVFLAELENTAKVNILVDEVNLLAASGKFREALEVVNTYEQKNGMSTGSDKVREFLSKLIQLDETLAVLQNPKNSEEFKKALLRLENLGKKMEFSPKIRNFASAKLSEYGKFRLFEYGSVCFNLWSEAMFFKTEDPAESATFAALLGAMKSDFPFYTSLLPLENDSAQVDPADIKNISK